MDKLKFYKRAAILLLLVNIGVIAFLFFGRPPHHNAQKLLDLDEAQHNSFLELVETHKELMRGVEQEQRALLKTYFSTLTKENELGKDTIFTKIQALEQQKITSTYAHFKEVKNLLRPNQIPKFDRFINHALRRILSKGKRKRHHK